MKNAISGTTVMIGILPDRPLAYTITKMSNYEGNNNHRAEQAFVHGNRCMLINT